MNLFDCTFPPLKIDKPIRLIELFAGIGAQAKALENLGVPFEHYRICEFDKYAVASYNAIHGTSFETSDITKIRASDLAVVDTDKYEYIMTYSFPCQDLSNAGKQRGMAKGTGTRSGLLWEVERLLNEMDELPQILVMENVPAVVGEKNKADSMEWVWFLQSKGYTCKWDILNAKDYGIPQNRERCFMVSYLGDYLYEFPQGFPLKLRLRDVLEDEVDEKYYIKGEAADRLCSQLLKVERERERQVRQYEPEVEVRSISTNGTPSQSGLNVVGSLKPEKKIRRRERVMSPDGTSAALLSTDYKGPQKIVTGGVPKCHRKLPARRASGAGTNNKGRTARCRSR